MPELSRFYGIIISMFYNDHGPPHIHAYNGDRKSSNWEIVMSIRGGRVLMGKAPSVAIRLVREWVRLHENELLDAWDDVQSGKKPAKIDPLRTR